MNGRSSLYLANAGSSREERRDDLLSIGRRRLRPAATVPPAFPVPVRVLRAFVHGPVVELDCEGDRVVDVLGRGVAEIEALDGVHGVADFGVAAGAGGRASGVAGGCVVGLVVGPGSDLSEEPAVQDVEPVTLDLESCPSVLPGPLIT